MGDFISEVKSGLRRFKNQFGQKAKSREGMKTLGHFIQQGFPAQLRSGLIRIISGAIPSESKSVFEKIEAIRQEIEDRGNEEVPIFYSPKPIDPNSDDASRVTTPGELKTFTCEHLAKNTSVPKDVGQLMHLIARDSGAQTLLELGSCVGIGASYLASVPTCQRFISFEGSAGLAKIAKHSTLQVFEKAEMYNLMFEEGLDTVLPTLNQDLDFAWIDGHHEKQATLHYFDRIKPHLKKGAIVAFDDIYWSTDMLEAWEQLRQAKGFSHTIDVGVCGIGIWTGEDQSPREWSVNRFVRSGNWQPQKPAGWKQA